MSVFLSYQTEDRHIAAEISKFFRDVEIEPFMAHEHIELSQAWQDTILLKLEEAEIFVAVLTERYLKSEYCIQESGIAVFCEEELAIMPLSIDGTLPPGFMKHIQARRFEPGRDNDAVLFGGLASFDVRYSVDLLVNRLGACNSFASAEKWFGILRPYIPQATPQQKVDVLEAAAGNGQFAASWGCKDGLSQLYEKHGHRLDDNSRTYLEKMLDIR